MQNLAIWITLVAVTTIGPFTSRIEAQDTATTIARDKEAVRYSRVDSSFGQKITLADIKNTLGPSATKKQSPQGTRYLVFDSADFSKPGPWTTTVLIGGVGLEGRLLRLSFVDHGSGGVQVHWLNEKLLFIEVWWGRIVSTDLILDVSSRRFLYKEMAEYGDMIQPCH